MHINKDCNPIVVGILEEFKEHLDKALTNTV